MATFLMSGKYSSEALAGISAERTVQVTNLIEKFGGEVQTGYALLGETDLEKPSVEALLVNAIPHKDDRRHYMRVRLEEKDGKRYAHLAGNQGSGVLSSMVKADGLAVIPEEWHSVPAGQRVRVMLLD